MNNFKNNLCFKAGFPLIKLIKFENNLCLQARFPCAESSPRASLVGYATPHANARHVAVSPRHTHNRCLLCYEECRSSQFAAKAGSPEVNVGDYIIEDSKKSPTEKLGFSNHGIFRIRPRRKIREPEVFDEQIIQNSDLQ